MKNEKFIADFNEIAQKRDNYLVNRIVKTEVYLDKIWQLVIDNCNGFDIFEHDCDPSEKEIEQKKIQLRLKGEI